MNHRGDSASLTAESIRIERDVILGTQIMHQEASFLGSCAQEVRTGGARGQEIQTSSDIVFTIFEVYLCDTVFATSLAFSLSVSR